MLPSKGENGIRQEAYHEWQDKNAAANTPQGELAFNHPSVTLT